MSMRNLIIFCHWSVFILMLVLVKGGTAAVGWRWAFVGVSLLWLGCMAVQGLRARPGAKLTGALRHLFRPLHWAMYGFVAVSVGLNLTALLQMTPLVWAWNSLLAMFAASMLHAILHLWRHTALNDGALRMITPKSMHKHL